jgi:hypothetical protein
LYLLTLIPFIIFSINESENGVEILKWERLTPVISFCIISIILLIWLDRGTFFERYVYRFGLVLLGTEISNPATDNALRMSSAGIAPVVRSFIKRMFHDFLYVTLSLITLSAYVIRREISPTRTPSLLLLTVFWFLISGFFQLLQLLTQSFGTFSLFIFRFVGPTVIFSPLFISLGIILNEKEDWVFPFLVALLVITSTVGTLSTHPDPYTGKTNYQVTESELDGAKWLSNYAAQEGSVVAVRSIPWRLADYVIGKEERRQSSIFVRGESRVGPEFKTLRNDKEDDTYLYMAAVDMNALQNTKWPWSQYSIESYNQVTSRRDLIYSSGDVEITK